MTSDSKNLYIITNSTAGGIVALSLKGSYDLAKKILFCVFGVMQCVYAVKVTVHTAGKRNTQTRI